MMRGKRWLAALLAVTLLPVSAAAGGVDAKERQEDLDFLVQTLTEKHPDFYRNTSEQAVADKKAAIESTIGTASEFDFVISLQELTALAGDSHTMLSIGSAGLKVRMLPFVPEWYDGRWTLTAALKRNQEHIGSEITAINGVPLDEVMRRLEPMVSYDNETRLRGQFGGNLYVFEVLERYGVVKGDETSVPLTVRAEDGTETVLDMPVSAAEEEAAFTEEDFVQKTQLRTAVPVTEPDAGVIYKLLDLGDGTLYMQYNKCFEDPEQPMEAFAAEIQKKLGSGAYSKFIIDLRNNGGGSDGVLYPVVYQAQQFVAKGGAAYALIGDRTFSSALINAVQIKDADAVVVGTPTGGSVDHFGSVSTFELPHSKIKGQYSNKFIDMADYMDAAKPYDVESFPPDILVNPSFADYLNGVDTGVQYIMQNAPVHPALTAVAEVSAARVVVNGKPVAAAAYEIADSNYFKLRDLAVAFTDTANAFQVRWDEAANRVTLSDGAYTPVGGELQPLTGGDQTAVRATTDVYAEEMPLVGKAYEIAGNHYFKLRDLCRMAGVKVEWEDNTRTIFLTTATPEQNGN